MQGVRLFLSLAAAGLATSRVLAVPDLSVAPSPNGTVDPELDKRSDWPTDGGVIIGWPGDSLYTNGLATCVGMTGIGDPIPLGDENRYDRLTEEYAPRQILAHVQCEADKAAQDMRDWSTLVRGANFARSLLAVSVANPYLQPPELQDAQKVLNRLALQTATDVAVGGLWTVQVVERQSLDGGLPLGSMEIERGGTTNAEGAPVAWPAVPTLEVDCGWPTRYTPAKDPEETRQRMVDLGHQICISANGCAAGMGTPHCVVSDDRPLG
ncbi:hypothetical protein PG985_013175 [Apiospora marii]|uniref:uncharacterized protein n=1 Tax=Apiospora marii TaxID=335849 RepID=UPI00312CFB9C